MVALIESDNATFNEVLDGSWCALDANAVTYVLMEALQRRRAADIASLTNIDIFARRLMPSAFSTCSPNTASIRKKLTPGGSTKRSSATSWLT